MTTQLTLEVNLGTAFSPASWPNKGVPFSVQVSQDFQLQESRRAVFRVLTCAGQTTRSTSALSALFLGTRRETEVTADRVPEGHVGQPLLQQP